MDTKSKNNFLYTTALILSFYIFAFLLIIAVDFIRFSDYLISDSHYSNTSLNSELSNYFRNLREFHLDYNNYDKKSGDNKLSKEELDSIRSLCDAELKFKINEIENNYNIYIYQAENAGDKAKISDLIEEKNKKLDYIKTEYYNEITRMKNNKIAVKDNMYDYLKKYISSKDYIKYYIKDDINKETYTNLEYVSNIKNYIKSNSLYSIKFPQDSSNNIYLSSISKEFKDSGFEGYFIIPIQLNNYNHIDDNLGYYNSIRSNIIKNIVGNEGIFLLIFLTIGICLLIYLRKNKKNEPDLIKKFKILWINLPIDLKVIIFIAYAPLMISYIIDMPFFCIAFSLRHIFVLTLMAIYTAYFVLIFNDGLSLLKNRKEFKSYLENTFCLKLFNTIKNTLLPKLIYIIENSSINKNTMFKISLIFILTIILGLSIGIEYMPLSNDTNFLIILSRTYIILYLLIFPYYIIKKVSLLSKITKGVGEIVSGNLDYLIDETGTGNLSNLARNINNMKTGFKKALESQLKSERLKSELITNVSHDLKTPLTSIINYVNLLKTDNLSKEETQGYVGVLDRKTQRLKVLIEDLFEVSKMASGAVELNIERIDVCSLLNQALAEFDDKIKNSKLTFKISIPDNKIYADLDGKKTWRVFENLISNSLKYSQHNTRVYIDLVELDNKIVFTIKNISAYELNFDVDEIFERFKRGDISRTTEGSGLGLAIAKSIVELQGGTLNIEIDGDLFKAIVKFNK